MRRIIRFVGRIAVILISIELLLSVVRVNSPVENPNRASLSLRSILDMSVSGARGQGNVLVTCGQGLAITAGHAFGAALISVVLGLTIGLSTGFSKKLREEFASPIVDFFRAVPVTLMSVIAVMATGRASDWGLVALVCIPCTAMMASMLFKGIELLKSERIEIFKINNDIDTKQKTQLFLRYHIPALRPEIALGVKLVTSYAIVVACVLEMMGLGASKSAGRIIGEVLDNKASDIGGVPLLLIVALGLLAYFSSCIFDRLEKNYANQKY